MALFHVSHPPWLRLVGLRTSYIYFSNISWTPWVLDPITNPFLGPSSWLHPTSIINMFFLISNPGTYTFLWDLAFIQVALSFIHCSQSGYFCASINPNQRDYNIASSISCVCASSHHFLLAETKVENRTKVLEIDFHPMKTFAIKNVFLLGGGWKKVNWLGKMFLCKYFLHLRK